MTRATFKKNHIDFVPLGDSVETVCTLIHGAENVDFEFVHRMPGGEVTLSTREMREMLGADIPLSSIEVISWVREYLRESYNEVSKNN